MARVENVGYCGIGILNLKLKTSYEKLSRSAYCFDADFIFLVNKGFDSSLEAELRDAELNIPLFEYSTVEDFLTHIPCNCKLVSVDFSNGVQGIEGFVHPERACYVLGPDDGGVPKQVLEQSYAVIKIPTKYCLHVETAGSIVLYDRRQKQGLDKL